MPLAASVGAAVCLDSGNADRVAVVLHEEHRGRLPHGREVQRLVGVALAGRPVAEQRERHHVLPAQPRAVRQADRVQRVGRQRRALRRNPELVRVIPAVPVPAQQGERLLRRHPAGEDRDRVPVGGEQPVRLPQREHRPHLAGVLPARRRVHRQPALLGQRGALHVHLPPEHHPPVQVKQDLRRRHRERARVAPGPAVLVNQLQRCLARQQAGSGRRSAGVGDGNHGHSPLKALFQRMPTSQAGFPGVEQNQRQIAKVVGLVLPYDLQ